MSTADEQDATNIARILIELGDQDVLIETNSRINQKKRWPWMGKPGEVNWEDWMSTLQPVNLPKSNAPVVEELKEKERVIAAEENTEQKSAASPARSDETAVEEASSGSLAPTDGNQAVEAKGVQAPVLGPVVAVKKEETKWLYILSDTSTI
jgi:hypothetical protein